MTRAIFLLHCDSVAQFGISIKFVFCNAVSPAENSFDKRNNLNVIFDNQSNRLCSFHLRADTRISEQLQND